MSAAVGPQLPQRRDHALGLDVVEVGRGLVGEQHRRIGGEATGDGTPLHLAA